MATGQAGVGSTRLTLTDTTQDRSLNSMANPQSTIEYRTLPAYPNYRIGNDGSVWSRYHLGGTPRIAKSRKKDAKLSEADIPEILRLKVKGLSNVSIANLYGAHNSQISRIVGGKRWKHVKR